MTRFVLFSHGRAGTNFVMNNLRAHPDVRAFMEPFHNEPGARAPVDGQRWETGQSSAAFARDVIWTGQKPVEGFKLFYFHARQDLVSADIWTALRADHDVKLIFVNRRNLLMKHLSDLRAQASGVWHPTTKDYKEKQYNQVVELQVDVTLLNRVMVDLYCGYHRVADIFAGHQALHLFYEDFAADGPGNFGRIQDFLGLERKISGDGFRADTLTPATTRIKNAPAVRNFLAKSVFADFLADCPLL